jgi:hyperosmotically inducible protein
MAEQLNRGNEKPFEPIVRPFIDDAELARNVKEALLTQTDSAGIDIKVAAEDGWVRLYGVVDTLSQKSAAEEIARQVTGVRRIENDITVANEGTLSDRDLLDAITERLTKKPEHEQIGVRVHKGVVTLVGHAETYEDVQEAVRAVEAMPGVKEVHVKRVKVGEGREEDDADVSRAAERMLDRLGYNSDLFQVYTADGTLFVKGLVPTRADRSRIKTAMHEIPGVDKLEALLIPEDEMLQDDEIH